MPGDYHVMPNGMKHLFAATPSQDMLSQRVFKDNIKHGTLSAGTVSVVTLDDDFGGIEVMNRDATNEIYVRVDGTDPSVTGDDSWVVMPNMSRKFSGGYKSDDGLVSVVKLISSGAAKYSVIGTMY